MARLFSVLAMAAAVAATPLDDYVNKPDPNYGWVDTGVTINTLLGGRAYVLNVTSQQWLDPSRAYVPGHGSIWTHQVVVVVPHILIHKKMAVAYITGNCNENPGAPSATDEELLLVDTLTKFSGVVGIIIYQIPNCPMVYPSDPSQAHRTEDAVIAWAWHEYLVSGGTDPEWIPRLPMVKGAMASMKGAQDFLQTKNIAQVDGWVVAGASKRGWTTWMVGAVTCPSCVNIIAIAPLVPIVPNLKAEIHRMWQAYDGFTFAFSDYTAINLTTHVDDPVFGKLLDIVDPMYYYQRLARLPKMVVLSSDDEFMMMDWSNIWYNDLLGEKHLLIAPNSEHSLATGVPEVVETLNAMIKSLAAGKTTRPNFDYTYTAATGEIVVTPTPGFRVTNVTIRHGETLQQVRRDFRWVRLASPDTTECVLPDIKLPKPIFGGNCLVPIVWETTVLTPTGDGSYHAIPPAPKHKGGWVGYFVEVKFAADTDTYTQYHFTTPGYTFPNTLPFADCTGEGCIPRLL